MSDRATVYICASTRRRLRRQRAVVIDFGGLIIRAWTLERDIIGVASKAYILEARVTGEA